MAINSITKEEEEPVTSTLDLEKTAENIDPSTIASSEEEKYPAKPKLITLTFALMLVVAMSGLDSNITGTAIPVISAQFSSPTDIGWYGAAYLLGILSLQGTYGNLYRLFNIKWVFIVAILLFEAGSAVSASAPSSLAFIFGRSILGCGAAGTLSGAVTIGPNLVPLRQRPFYISLVMSVYGIAGAIAPILGGVFTNSHTLTWRFSFWLNLPFGSMAALIVLIGYASRDGCRPPLPLRTKLKRLDLGGAVFLISSMLSLFFALQWGGLKFPWSDSRVWGCTLGFGLLFTCFLIIQYLREDEATIPFRIVTKRSIAAACLFTLFLNSGHYTILYYMPFYFQGVRGAIPRRSGTDLLPYVLSIFISAIIAGFVVTKKGTYVPFMWTSAAIFAVACGLIHTIGAETPTSRWIGFEILAGLGFGIGFQMPYTLVQASLEGNDKIVGNALIVFCQAFGGSISLSVAQNIFSTSFRARLGPHLEPLLDHGNGGHETDLLSKVPGTLQGPVSDSYAYAFSQTFIMVVIVASIAFACSLAVEWKRIGTGNT